MRPTGKFITKIFFISILVFLLLKPELFHAKSAPLTSKYVLQIQHILNQVFHSEYPYHKKVLLRNLALDNDILTPENAGNQKTSNNDTLGVQHVVVLLVNFQGYKRTPITTEKMREKIFTGQNSLNAFIKENSFGKTTLEGDVFGYYTINAPLPKSVDGCDMDQYKAFKKALETQSIITADPDVNFSKYDRFILAFPYVPCYGSSAGTLGKTMIIDSAEGKFLYSGAFLNGYFRQEVIAHEFGHNLDLVHHANVFECHEKITISPLPNLGELSECTSKEYMDKFSIMGSSLFYLHFNSYNKEKLDWFDPNQIMTITQSGEYFLTPYAAQNNGVKVLKIFMEKNSDGKNVYYYIEFRQKIGFDDILSANSPLYQGLLIRHAPHIYEGGGTQLLDMTPNSIPTIDQNEDNPYLAVRDFYDATLTVGNQFDDVDRGIHIKPISINSDGILVRIEFD